MGKSLVTLFLLFSLFSNAQKSTVQFINQTKAIKDDKIAYRMLDSCLTRRKHPIDIQLRLKQELVIRSLNLQRYDLLNKQCYEGIELAKKHHKDSLHAYFQKQLGHPHYYHGEFLKAIKCFKKSAAIVENKPELVQILAANYNNIGGAYLDYNDNKNGERYLLKSLAVLEKAHQTDNHIYFLSKRVLASLYGRTKQYQKAYALYDDVLKFAIQNKDTNLWSAALVFKSALKSIQEKHQEALVLSTEAMRLMELQGDKHSLIANYMFHASNFQRAGNYKEAYNYSLKYLEISREIYRKESQYQMNQLEAKFKTREIKKQAELKSKENLILKKKNQLYLAIAFGILSAAFVIFLLFYLRNQRKRQKLLAKMQLERLQAIIEGEEKEKNRLARELHDGVVQELVAFKHQLNQFEQLNEEERKAMKIELEQQLTTTTREVRDLAHELMPVSLQKQGLISALKDLVDKAFKNTSIQIDFTVNQVNKELSQTIQTNLYRICQELINNTIKYSEATEVNVILSERNNNLLFIFEDNGKGFIRNQKSTGFGLFSIQSRVLLIKGELNIESEPGQGSSFTIKIPLS
jgi:signal transduction histidine kinase